MEQETVDKIRKMVGTEFAYIFSDRSEIPAVVAAFDPKIGFTCLATSLTDSHGDDHSNRVDQNGNFCLTGYSAQNLNEEDVCSSVLFMIKSIQCLGYYKINSEDGFGHRHPGGSARCSF